MRLHVEVTVVWILHGQRSVFQRVASKNPAPTPESPASEGLHVFTLAAKEVNFWIRVVITKITHDADNYWFEGTCQGVPITGCYPRIKNRSGWFEEPKPQENP